MVLTFRKRTVTQQESTDIKVPGYHNLQRIFDSPRSRVFRATRQSDGKKVVMKILQEEFLERTEVFRYKNQYSILNDAQLKCSPKVLAISKYHNSPMIVFEDTEAESLRSLLDDHRLNIEEVLWVATELAKAVLEVHNHSIIHKDLNPSNILYDSERKIVQIIDFGISTQLSREQADLDVESVTEGSLPYMSPEQTGRMNRFVDSRSDLYSLGVVLYEMLAGKVPFESEDPLQLIHFHIAKRPIALRDIDSEIPEVLSDIIQKLLAKNVEDRYQSALGAKVDLEKCLDQYQSTQYIRNFTIGLKDVSSQLRISQNLYGRSHEVGMLQGKYHEISKGKRNAVFVSGYPGIGKTSLTKELYKKVYQDRGFYISGKYEVLRRSIPYSAISDALNELCRQVLSEPELELKEWRSQIIEALGTNAQVVVDLAPDLEHIIGVQEPATVIGASETENRFMVLFKRFLGIFAHKNRPLVLYLDDLQWIDLSSVKLLQVLLEDLELEGLFFIGAYRDKELSSTHPLVTMIDGLGHSEISIENIHLMPLSQQDINRMVADSLQTDPQKTEGLTRLVYSKTGGNPFFTEEFLKNLHNTKLLRFDNQQACWQWDLERIKLADLSDNVVELMASKIKGMSKKTVQMIRHAACIGARFDLETLAIVLDKTPGEVGEVLHEAIEEGLIIPIGDNYRLVELDMPVDSSQEKVEFRFAHDRILQAASDLLESDRRKKVRKQVAHILLDRHRHNLGDIVFAVVNHLNHSSDLINNDDERLEFIKLNLMAAKKAKTSSAYALAHEYLSHSYTLIKSEIWANHRDLMMDFCHEACEVSFLAGKVKDMDRFGSLVLMKANNLLEQIPIYETQVQSAIAQNDMSAAVEQGREILAQLGVRVSKNPGLLKVLLSFAQCWWKLLGVSDQKIIKKAKMKDKQMLARMHFQYSLSQCLFLYLPKQVPLSICDTVLMTLKHGTSPTSALAFSSYGIMVSGIFGAYDKGYRYGELGIKLYKKLKAKEVEAAILVTFNLYIRPWKDPIRSTLAPLIDAYHSGLETGNIEFAVHGAMGYCYRSFLAGVELPTVSRDMRSYQQGIHSLGHQGNTYILDLYQQVVSNLEDETTLEPWRIKGDFYDDDDMLVTHRQNKDAAGLFLTYYLKVFVAYLFDQNELALEWGRMAQKEFKAGIGTYNGTVFYFYRALSLLRAIDTDSGNETKAHIKEVKALLKKFKKWSKGCYANQGHRYLILKAEYRRLQGRSYRAQQLFDEAISTAKRNEFYQDEALANELAARFHLEENRSTMASAYMKRARFAYSRWGAKAKIASLEQSYPHLISSPGDRNLTSSLATMSSSTIDITTLKKALLAIAEETIHSRMLEKIISSAIEFAGAQKGTLLLKKDGEFFVEAEGSTELESPHILQSIALDESEGVCIQVVNYVKRTGKAIVIDDATKSSDQIPGLDRDAYVLKHKVKSILCIPIVLGGSADADIIGLLYLENNHTSNTFTVERIETLEIICLSAAGRLELSVRAATDGLTGLYNHDYFQNMLSQEILQSQRQQRKLSLVMIDIDHFKQFNDSWGHQVGDKVLKHVADVIKQTCRKSDIVARYGGEELSVILPETNSELAAIVAERIRNNIEQSIVEYEGHHLSVKVSIGVSYLRDDLRTAESLIKKADEALYQSKDKGRNMVTVF